MNIHNKIAVVVVVVVMMVLNGHCLTKNNNNNSSNEYIYDDDYKDGCHPEEANHCFDDVNQNLMCNLVKASRNCADRDSHDLCMSMGEALNCSQDIMMTCTTDDGLSTFKTWLAGLRGVYTYLCIQDPNLTDIKVLLERDNCFRLKRFVNCVEERAGITRIADLLTTQLDLYECNKIQVSVGACIEDSEKNRKSCQGKSLAIFVALHVFFTETLCGQPSPPPPPPSPPLPASLPPCVQLLPLNESREGNSSSSSDIYNPTTTTTTTTITSPSNSSGSSSGSSNQDTTTPTLTTKPMDTPTACHQKSADTTTTSKASTVLVTALVTVVVMLLAGLILVKRGVLTVRSDFDRRLAMSMRESGDSSTGYDRF